jgi:hypothetical protein
MTIHPRDLSLVNIDHAVRESKRLSVKLRVYIFVFKKITDKFIIRSLHFVLYNENTITQTFQISPVTEPSNSEYYILKLK